MTQDIAEYTKDENLPASGDLFFNVKRFEHAQRVAKVLSESSMVPDHFKKNIGNCLIALNYAERLEADPFMVMQRMYVIQGKPGIEGQLVIALINQCGRFNPLQFEEKGNITDFKNETDGVYAWAAEKRSGKVLEGPIVTWGIVKNEGWYNKNGSKWQTMAPLMFRYRAATFFARTYCPEVLLGMHTVEELRDVYDMRPSGNGKWQVESGSNELEDRLLNGSKAEPVTGAEETSAESAPKEPETESAQTTDTYDTWEIEELKTKMRALFDYDKEGMEAAKTDAEYKSWPRTHDGIVAVLRKYHQSYEY